MHNPSPHRGFSRIFAGLLLSSLALGAAIHAKAQTQSPSIGNGGGTIDQQIIGDTTNTADRTNSTTNMLGNSAATNGNDLSTSTDIRTQISPTNNSDTSSSATGGSATGNIQGPQTMGQANTGNSSASTGASTSNAQGGGGGGGGGGGTGVGVGLGGAGGSSGVAGSGNSTAAGGTVAGSGNSTQGQQQGIAGSGNSRNSQATSAGNGAGAGAGSGNKTANTTSVDASDRSSTVYQSKTTVWAPVVHGAGAAPLAAANLVIFPGVCTPYTAQIISTPLVGKRFGVWGGQDDVEQGLNDRAEYVTYKDTAGQPIPLGFVRVGNVLWGERTNRAIAVVGTSSGGSFSLGGFGRNGDGAQGGGAASGQLQQIAVNAWTEKCPAYEVKEETFTEPPPPPADRSHGPRLPRPDRN